MRRVPYPAGQSLRPRQTTPRDKNRWSSRVHFERRNGLVSYCVSLSNGKLSATIRGGFSRLPVAVNSLQEEAFDAATAWMAHVQPGNGAPKPQIKRLHYIRNQTRTNNHKRKEHRSFRMRRAAA